MEVNRTDKTRKRDAFAQTEEQEAPVPARPDASQPSAHTKRFQPARAPGPQREGALTLPSPRRTQRGRGRRRHIAGQARVKQRGRHSSSASAVPGAGNQGQPAPEVAL